MKMMTTCQIQIQKVNGLQDLCLYLTSNCTGERTNEGRGMKQEGEKLQCSHINHASIYVCVINARESGHVGNKLSNLVEAERRLPGN